MYDVAIAGYGPVGAVAAALLGQAGLRVWVGDRLPDVYEIPRAIALDHEIMRVFQQIGVAEAVAPYCEPFTPSEYLGVDGQLIRRLTMLPPPYPQGYCPSLVFTQPPVERALRARVAQLPNVTVALSTEVRKLTQDAHSVTLEVAPADAPAEHPPTQVHARWALVCDGGSSRLRGALGIALTDLAFDEPWLVVDVLCNEQGLARLPTTSVQYCEPERPCTYVIGPGHHRRWEISLRPGEDPRQVATEQGTWGLLSRWIGPEHGRLWRQSSYRFHALVAERWRQGRAFLAGDAAHMQPPFLGQGMCQGIRDAVNFCWKLISVVQGEVQGVAAERLLDSYGQERDACVRELTRRLKAIGAVICERDEVRARARDAELLAQCGGQVKDTPRQDVLPRLECGVLAAEDTPGRGSLFPQPWLVASNGQMRMDHLLGIGWRLVLSQDMPVDDAGRAAEALPGCTVLHLGQTPEVEGVLSAWFDRHQCRAALVRPDHYVFGTCQDASGVNRLLSEARRQLSGA